MCLLLFEVCLHQADPETSDFTALAFNQLSSHLFQLHTLVLDVQSNAPLHLSAFAGAVPKLPNLQHLELVILGDDPWGLRRLAANFLQASAHLKLVLQVRVPPTWWTNDITCCDMVFVLSLSATLFTPYIYIRMLV